jgi:hypothetical protein
MDAPTFDRWTAAMVNAPTRRGALRLLAGGLLGGWLSRNGTVAAIAAQRSDRDGDGLFDDDETDVYGTNPDVFDTDGDGVGDGEEVYLGTDPLRSPTTGCAPGECVGIDAAPRTGTMLTCAEAGLTDCSGVCADTATDPSHCGGCGFFCSPGQACVAGTCSVDPNSCGSQGLAFCNGVCADLNSDSFNRGTCGNPCPLGGFCQGGVCGGVICMDGLTDCGGFCTNLLTDRNNCGVCGGGCFGANDFGGERVCVNGRCVD